MNIKPSTIFTADNLDILRGIDSECVDLIYLDPPFNSNKNYSAPVGSKAAGAHFKDTWSLSDTDDAWWGQIADKYPDLYRVIDAVGAVGGNSNKSYCIYMAMRLLEMHRILKPTGSIYYHCDPTMSHSIKLLMDAIFGTAQFRNEIVWCYKGAETATRRFSSKHDLLLLYTKTKNYTYNMQYHEHSKAQLARYNVVKADGSRWANMKGKLRKLGPGKRISDWWLINVLTNNDKEREGYPTQKPLQLLRRVVLASSNPGDLVLDPFCGCATACVAAEIEGREWVGIDISAMAYSLIKRRFKKPCQNWIFRQRIIGTAPSTVFRCAAARRFSAKTSSTLCSVGRWANATVASPSFRFAISKRTITFRAQKGDPTSTTICSCCAVHATASKAGAPWMCCMPSILRTA